MEDENNVRMIEEESEFIMEIVNMPIHKKILLQGIIIGLDMAEQKE